MPLRLTEAFVTLSAKNFEPLVQFYGQLLERSPDVYSLERYAEFQLPGMRLGIFCPKGGGDGVGGEDGGEGETRGRGDAGRGKGDREDGEDKGEGMAICLEVENLEGAIAHLGAIGCPPPGNITTASHGREIHAYDPDGNWLILHQF